ncbi:MAG: ABC transporter ATP-binding protein [Deltaproteobacteria bacterium]|nr:ABC transporter ATP-binding protein [Deltaproteobacteria bacterium]
MIEVSHLRKTFGDFVAVDDVSFSVADGECVGFLGPNGAGKTTTMRVIAGIFPPTQGTVRVGGFDVRREPLSARRVLGYFPENAPFYPEMSVEGYLGFVARAKRIPSGDRPRRVEEAIAACALEEMRHRLVGKLSKGYRQRVGLAQALLGDPRVLVLDEPTSGLDPGQVTGIRELVKSLRGKRTIVFSSHILSEVSQVAQRVVIVNRGKLVAEDSPEGLSRRLAGALPLWLRADTAPEELAVAVGAVRGVQRAEVAEDRVRLVVDDESVVPEVSRAVTSRGWVILELSRETLSLEDIFLRLVGSGSGSVNR